MAHRASQVSSLADQEAACCTKVQFSFKTFLNIFYLFLRERERQRDRERETELSGEDQREREIESEIDYGL